MEVMLRRLPGSSWGKECQAPIAFRESWDNGESNHLHQYDELKYIE